MLAASTGAASTRAAATSAVAASVVSAAADSGIWHSGYVGLRCSRRSAFSRRQLAAGAESTWMRVHHWPAATGGCAGGCSARGVLALAAEANSAVPGRVEPFSGSAAGWRKNGGSDPAIISCWCACTCNRCCSPPGSGAAGGSEAGAGDAVDGSRRRGGASAAAVWTAQSEPWRAVLTWPVGRQPTQHRLLCRLVSRQFGFDRIALHPPLRLL